MTQAELVNLLRMTTDLRTYMLTHLTDADLLTQIQGNPTLGELCREMGNVQRAYMDSFTTLKLDFSAVRDDSADMATQLDKLTAWYQALDAEFEALLLSFSESEFEAKVISRGGWTMPATAHYHTYREALLIFYAKASIYLRMLGKPLNEQWVDWIG